MKKIYLFFLIFPIIFVACKKNKDAEISTFSIQNENIVPSSTTMELSCDVVCSATIKELYLQYGTKKDFEKYEEVKMNKNGKSSYSVTIDNLIENTTYYVRYLAVNSYSSMQSEKISAFKTLTKSEYVDLGLSVKWATCNIGAKRPEDYGDYFAWGEVKSKAQYSWNTYKYYHKEYGTITKYYSSQSIEGSGLADSFDGRTKLDPEDDVATVNKGNLWRIPTISEIYELCNKCTWIWTIQNGVNGYKVEGKNGNSIFLPAAGYMDGSTLEGADVGGYYWSKNFHSKGIGISVNVEDDKAQSVRFNSSSVDEVYSYRYYGFSVRPIYYGNSDNSENNQYTISVLSNDSSYGVVSGGGTYDEGRQVTITATANSGYRFKEWNDGNTDNPRVITVTQDESYIAVFEKFEPEYVDLGLPSGLKWATCNVGATKPDDYGDYFAWGEVEPKTTYTWSTYKYGKAVDQLTKYCNDSKYGKDGFTDNKIVLDPEDDAATANWGGTWRMPTKTEQDELRNNCTWTWTTQNGVTGYKVVGPNGNSIFLPAAGYRNGTSLSGAGSSGYYWSSSLRTSNPDYAYYVRFYSSDVYWDYDDRYYGFIVRPVYGERTKYSYTITVSANSSSYGTVSGGGTYEEGTQVTLTATAKAGYKFTEWNDGNTDNPRVITVTQDESYTAYFEKESTENARHEYVDLGLPSGLQWATCNVGATKPEEYGDYFAWGEVESKENYVWSTYKYGKQYDRLTKYCNDSEYGKDGFVDNKIVLDPEDDAATANWGGVWRMPTHDEFTELREKCTWTWTTQNGVNGCNVIGPNGNSIFLPAAGVTSDGSLRHVGTYAYYWSSSLYTDRLKCAYSVGFYGDFVGWYNYDRYYGHSVRPVWGGGTDDSTTKNKYTITVSANSSSYGTVSGGGTYEEGTQMTLTATANSGYRFVRWNDGNTDNPRVITVTQDESYTAYFEVEETMNAGHEYVDLGLPSGLKWATCNVGANSPEEYGDYFAWGETKPKEIYDWSTYKYCKGTNKTMTKYCNNSSYGNGGFTDTKTILDPEDDAATVNWGGSWRMPTDEEMIELWAQCKWTWIQQGGVNGYKVVGPNGNSIFLTVAGYRNGSSLHYAGSDGYYWSSSLGTSDPNYAYYVYFNSSIKLSYYYDRYGGFVVRPVCP